MCNEGFSYDLGMSSHCLLQHVNQLICVVEISIDVGSNF